MHRVYMTERKVFIAVYSRKSKFTGKGESIENQIELCREYIRIQKGEEAVKNIVVQVAMSYPAMKFWIMPGSKKS